MSQVATASPVRPVEPTEDSICPICDERKVSKAWRLYGSRVCQKCAAEFIRRRRAAFGLDYFLIGGIVYMLAIIIPCILGFSTFPPQGLGPVSFGISTVFPTILFAVKDLWSGMSPGKWLLGVQVVDIATREPVGLTASIKRNLAIAIPCIGIVFILIAFTQMENGPRIGDGWAKTMVIWRKFARKPPFEGSGIYCPRCFYNLTGNVSGICPECGTPVPERTKEILAGAKAPGANL